jgi:uncharacterized membrane protein
MKPKKAVTSEPAADVTSDVRLDLLKAYLKEFPQNQKPQSAAQWADFFKYAQSKQSEFLRLTGLREPLSTAERKRFYSFLKI